MRSGVATRRWVAAFGAVAAALCAGCGGAPDPPLGDAVGGAPDDAVDGPPRRVISMAPNLTEILFEVGAGDQVVAVTDFCVYPPEAAAELPSIGAFLNPDIERMLTLRPDLVVLIPSQERVARRMAGAGVPTLSVRNERLSEVLESITAIGEATGHAERGRRVRRELEDGLAAVSARVAGLPPTRTLLVIGRGSGDLAGIFAVGPGAFLDDVLAAAGGRNVLDGALGLYPQVPLEEVLALAPEVIIEVVVPPSDLAPDAVTAAWSSLSTVPAVRDGRIHVLTDDYLLIPGPRAVRTAERLAPLLHPEIAGGGAAGAAGAGEAP